MKKLLFLLFLLPFLAQAQTGNDTTKYRYFQFNYGDKFNRVWGLKVVEIPTDTTNSKWGLARKDTVVYVGNGTKWTRLGGSGGGGSSYSADESTVHLGAGNIFSIINTYTGQTSIKTVGSLNNGSIAAGFTPIGDAFISSSATWNAKLGSSLTSAHLFVGNGSNIATDVGMSGDVSMNNAGATTLASVLVAGSCTNCNLTYDAKGRLTVAGNGAGGGSSTPFPDNSTLIKNNADNTKLLILGAANITTGTTRTIQSPDANGTIDLTSNTATLTNKTISGASNTLSNISEPSFAFTNVSTANATIAQHGLLPQLPNDATIFLNGVGSYSIPTKFTLPRKLIGFGGFTTDLLSYSSSFFYDSSAAYAQMVGGVPSVPSVFALGAKNQSLWLTPATGMEATSNSSFVDIGSLESCSSCVTIGMLAASSGSAGSNVVTGVLGGGRTGGTGGSNSMYGYRVGWKNTTQPTGTGTFNSVDWFGTVTGPDASQTNPVISNSSIFGHGINTDSSNIAIFGRADQRIILGKTSDVTIGGNTASMNAFAPIKGEIFFNTDSAAYCMYSGSAWIKWGGIGGSGGSGFADPLTTNGDIIARVGGVTTRLPKGANNTVLLTDGSGLLGYNLLTNSNLSGSAAISNANMHTMAAHTRVGNITAGTALPTDVTATQETADLNLFTTSTQGLVPASTGALTDWLNATGIWKPLPLDTFSLRTPGAAGIIIAYANAGALVIPKVIGGTGISLAVGADSSWTINATGGGGGGSSFTRQTHVSGATVTVTGGNYILTINPAATLATVAATLPAAPADMDIVKIEFGGTIIFGAVVTNFTVLPNSAQSIIDTTPPSGIATPDNYLEYQWRAAGSQWYRRKY